jgi:hypothetical protein
MPVLAFGILWFFVWLSPTNSVVPRLDVVNDRQLYAAIIGPAWLLAIAATRLTQWASTWAAIVSALTLVLLGVCTVQRNTLYFSEIAFWSDVTDKSPHNARAWNNLGFAYLQTCDVAQAANAFRRAIAQGLRYAAVNLHLLQDGALGCN